MELVRVLGGPRASGDGELQFRSPFVDDTKGKLYVNPRRGVFIDFKSGVSGSLSYLFRSLGLLDPERASAGGGLSLPPSTARLEDLRGRFQGIDTCPTVDTVGVALPDWYRPVQYDSAVHRYLRGRGISDEDIVRLRVGESDLGSHFGRVIVPSYGFHGEVEYWVARDVFNTSRMKYFNPRADRRTHLGALASALSVSPTWVVLTEGVFSALAAGPDAVYSYGKHVTEAQIDQLVRHGVHGVDIALDGDAQREAVKTAERILARGLRCKLIWLPKDKDPADLGRARFLELRQQAQEVKDRTGVLQARLLTLR